MDKMDDEILTATEGIHMIARGNKQVNIPDLSRDSTANASKNLDDICEYHGRNLVAYCVVHEELVCEECTDSEFHKDHND